MFEPGDREYNGTSMCAPAVPLRAIVATTHEGKTTVDSFPVVALVSVIGKEDFESFHEVDAVIADPNIGLVTERQYREFSTGETTIKEICTLDAEAVTLEFWRKIAASEDVCAQAPESTPA